jgi:hypothetical protein
MQWQKINWQKNYNEKKKKNIEAQLVYDPIVIPGQPHQKQVEYNNEAQLSNNLM